MVLITMIRVAHIRRDFNMKYTTEDIVFRLKERARIRRQIPTRKSVQEGAPDRIADLLEEAAMEIEHLRLELESWSDVPEGCPCGEDGGTSCGANCEMLK